MFKKGVFKKFIFLRNKFCIFLILSCLIIEWKLISEEIYLNNGN